MTSVFDRRRSLFVGRLGREYARLPEDQAEPSLALLVRSNLGIDLIHEAVGAQGILDELVFRILEEGGEMLVTSFIVWYIFLLHLRDGNIGWFLHEHLLRLLPPRAH